MRHADSKSNKHPFDGLSPQCAARAVSLEGLDFLGVDIDQDPRAFVKLLELKNLMQGRH